MQNSIINSTFLKIGNISIQWYAILIFLGASLCYVFSLINLKKISKSKKMSLFFDDLFCYVLLFGIIGARLYFCLFFNFNYYISNPFEIIAVWDGGLAIHGGLISGIIVAILVCKKYKFSFLNAADAIMPCVLLAQAIGRWGNYINQECYGNVVSENYYNGVLLFLKEQMNIAGKYYEPLFFYESISCIIGFVVLNFILRKFKKQNGQLFWGYMIWYGITRVFIEANRQDSLMFFSLKVAQLVSISLILIGLFGIFGLYRKFYPKPYKATIIFDLDGTLINTQDAIHDTLKTLFEKHNKLDIFNSLQSSTTNALSLDLILKENFDEDINELLIQYDNLQYNSLDKFATLNQNVLDVLKQLNDLGYTLCIYTLRDRKSTDYLLNKFSIANYFTKVVVRDDVTQIKPNIEGLDKALDVKSINFEKVVVVGDSKHDIECGKNINACTVLYTTNSNNLETNHDFVIYNLNDLLNILNSNI